MAKKKKLTLPKNFKDLIKIGDIEALKAIYDNCELDAYYDGRYGLNTALHCYDVPEELIRWLVEQGMDINVKNYYGRTPLHEQIDINIIQLLVKLGADIEICDDYDNRPLHYAAKFFRTDTVRFLIEQGADVNAENNEDQTPLAICLSCCRPADITAASEIANLLIDASGEITSDMRENVKRIGEDFEFHRENFNEDLLFETDRGLQKLYGLFEIEPIPKRSMHDGFSPIVLADDEWQKQYEMLWNLLVPSSGPSKTVQGEIIRITGRVQDELCRNGGANWDRNYRKMLNALIKHFSSEVALPQDDLIEAKELISNLTSDYDEYGITNKLCELAVKWVKQNPNSVQLQEPDYDR